MDIDDSDDWMSECATVYLVFLISSVKGARKATFFAAGNMGRDCAYDSLFRFGLGKGRLLRIEVMLYARVYGTSVEKESTVETEVMETAEDDVAEFVRLGMSVSKGVGALDIVEGTSVANGVKEGRFGLAPGV